MKARDKAIVIERFEQLRKKNRGILTPDAGVEDALANPNGPFSKALPKWFWDDRKCALEQRRNMMRSLYSDITHEVQRGHVRVANPVYVHTEGSSQGYRPLAEVRKNRQMSMRVLRDEVMMVEAHVDRALAIGEELGLAPEMKVELRKLLEKVVAIRLKLSA